MPFESPTPSQRPAPAADRVGPSAKRRGFLKTTRGRQVAIVAFIALHIPLALLMRAAPMIAVVHALTVLAVGVVIAVVGRLSMVPAVASYIVASEVLWRMTRAGIFWEFGKYAVSLVMFIALLRLRRRRNALVAFGYLAVLLPSAVLTIASTDLDYARQLLSFNLSGPLSLALSVAALSNLRLQASDLNRTMLAVTGPALGIAAIAYTSLAAIEEVEFINASSVAASGGFGPNQVSAILGLALMFCLLLAFDRSISWRWRGALIVIAVIVGVEATLTFSRGGIVLAFAGVLVALLFLVRERKTRVTLAIVSSLFFVVGRYEVVPRLEVFTKGKLSERYTDVDPSGRGELARYDLAIFADNPIFGVGPGMATEIRASMGHFGAAHTELTRLLSEHGIFGAVAGILLCFLMVRAMRVADGPRARALVGAMLVWFLLFLVVNAMRLAAPSFMLGLACCVAYSSRPTKR